MRIFISRRLSNGKSYKKQILVPIVGILTVLLIVPFAGGLLAAGTGILEPVWAQWFTLILLAALVITGCGALHRIAGNAHRDAFVFCLDDKDSVYVVNVRELAVVKDTYGRSAIAYLKRFFREVAAADQLLQQFGETHELEEAMHDGRMKDYGAEVIRVKCVQQMPAGTFATCDVTESGREKYAVRYDITDHGRELAQLLAQRSPLGKAETTGKSYRLPILVSAVLLGLCAAACVLSHPAVGILPEAVYLPCLFGAYIPGVALGIFIVKKRKGE